MDGLDIVGMIIPPCPSHSTGIDVVRHNVAIVGELSLAESAHAALSGDLSVHQFPHLSVGADLPISTRVFRIVNAADSHLIRSPFLGDGVPPAASERTVNRAQLISTQSHRSLPK